jgi:glycosyltransferase involved in cell wall biosynthesis
LFPLLPFVQILFAFFCANDRRKMITVSHPTVNGYVRALLQGLDVINELQEFHTTLAIGRRAVSIARSKVRQHPYREILRLLGQRCRQEWLIRHESGWASVDAVAQEFDRQVAKSLGRTAGIYCYEDSAFATFRATTRMGVKRYYELPIMYWETVQKLLGQEAERYPEWEPTLLATRDSKAKLERKSAELQLADLVICPSRQVQQSLPPGTPSIVAEYGCPLPVNDHPLRDTSRLKLLFVGSMTQRKGLADLFAAMKLLNRSDVQLIVLGTPLLPLEFYQRDYPGFVYEPVRPSEGVRRLMLACDDLVLPSIVEGRAMVQMEALSCGLPIIVTPNAGAEDLVEPQRTGFLVPIRDPEKLAESIGWIADHKQWVDDVRPTVLEKAKQSGWERYSDKIVAAIM